MLKVTIQAKPNLPCKILCLGAHCDDIEIGCGGTVLTLVRDLPKVEFLWVVFSSTRERAMEARKSGLIFLRGVSKKRIIIKRFRESFLPFCATEVKEYFELIKRDFSPDLVFTHYRDDRHQDHRIISDLTWNTFRNHLILEYEVPKYDGDFGSPNFFVPLTYATCQRKLRYIMDCFPSQRQKHWFTEDTFRSVARLRGMESCAEEKLAEGFYCRKMVMQ